MSLMSMIFLVICTYSFSRLRINDIVDFNYIRTYIDFYFYLFMKKKQKGGPRKVHVQINDI